MLLKHQKLSRRNRNTRYTSICKSSTVVHVPARTTGVLGIAAKPPRAAIKYPRNQHKRQAVLSNQPARSTNEAFINVQSDEPKPQSVIKVNDKSIISQGSGDDDKAIPKVSAPKPLALVHMDTSNLRKIQQNE